MTPLAVAGETRLILSRAEKQLALDALVVDDLDVDILAGTPFLIANDITVRPAKCQVRIQDSEIIHYEPTDDTSNGSHAVRRAQIFTLRAPSSATVVWPGEYLELDIPPDLGDDRILALQPRTDTPISKHTKPAYIWPEPQILEAVGSKIRLVNTSNEPKSIGRLEHLSQILPTTGVLSPTHSLQHLAGKANLPSDFTSRNAPDCNEPNCQSCTFIHDMEDSVVRGVSIQDILNNKTSLSFSTRSSWLQIQSDCPDLRRVHAHLKQGTRPSKKLTNVRDVKRYLNCTSIAKDGVLVVKRSQPFVPVIEAIVVPRSVLDGLLTALHFKLIHPSRHQFQMVLQRQFFALDMNDAISRVTSACHTCASLLSFPPSLISQSSADPPEVVGVSFAADVIKRHRQSILVLRECTTSFTASCLIQDERHDTLRDALTRLIIGLHPLDGPRAIVRVDPAPGFASMSNNDSLKHLNVTIEVGRVKNKNKNPVAEKAVRELEDELIRQEPGGRPVSDVGLAIATARLKFRLRFSGLSSRELWTQRNQFTHEQLPVSDSQFILAKHDLRSSNHAFSEKSKNPRGLVPNSPPLQVGDLVYLVSDKDESRARDRYIVVSTDPPGVS